MVLLPLQRHFGALAKFAHVESRFCGRKRRGKGAFDTPLNPCVRSACSTTVAVGLSSATSGGSNGPLFRSSRMGSRALPFWHIWSVHLKAAFSLSSSILNLLYASLLTPVASRNLLVYQSLPTSTPYRHANVRRQKDDACVGTAARSIVAGLRRFPRCLRAHG